jgi:hypothetical protein
MQILADIPAVGWLQSHTLMCMFTSLLLLLLQAR